MLFNIFDYVNARGENEFKIWTEDLQKRQRTKLNQKLDMLETLGGQLPPRLLSDSGTRGIKKLKIQGNVKLRPLLCEGPVNNHSEYTLLMGAKEIGDRWSPTDAPSTASNKKDEVVAFPNLRRKKHERVS